MEMIEKQEAIDALYEEFYYEQEDLKTAVYVIENLPSVDVPDIRIGSMTSIEQLSNLLTVAQDEGEITPEEFEKFHDLLDRVLPVEQVDKRDTPIPPNTTIDPTWGIKHKHPVCPNCDYYLPIVHFFPLSEDASEDAKRITYCEECGQAIDWRGFNYEQNNADSMESEQLDR